MGKAKQQQSTICNKINNNQPVAKSNIVKHSNNKLAATKKLQQSTGGNFKKQ